LLQNTATIHHEIKAGYADINEDPTTLSKAPLSRTVGFWRNLYNFQKEIVIKILSENDINLSRIQMADSMELYQLLWDLF